jgi:hypothetical protein
MANSKDGCSLPTFIGIFVCITTWIQGYFFAGLVVGVLTIFIAAMLLGKDD